MVKGLFVFTAFLYLNIGLVAQAQVTSSMELDANKKVKKSRFSALVIFSSESNLLESDSPDSQSTSSFIFTPQFNLNRSNTLGSTMVYLQSHDDDKKSQINNMKIFIKRNPVTLLKKGTLTFIQYFSGYLPTNQDSREIDSFQGAIEYDPRLAFTLNPTGVSLPITYRLRLKKNFHDYSLSEKAIANISHSVSNSLSLEKPLFGSNFSLGLEFEFSNAWTYRNTPRSRFSSSQSIGYAISNSTIFQIGHSNANSFYKTDGRTSNVEIFDEFNSTYSATMIMIF